MDRNALKSSIQEEVVNLWAQRGYYGYALISMGVGKSRLLALAIQRYLKDHPEFDYKKYDFPIVILVNSQELRDSNLPKELKKWGVTIKIKLVCYQTAYRWNKKIGLLLADELDFAVTSGLRYLQVFATCTYDHWLGVTGTMVDVKGEIANIVFQEAPFFKFPLSLAQTMGLINETNVWIHEVPLYTSGTASAPYGEVAKYVWIQNNILDAKIKISSIYDSLEEHNFEWDEVIRLRGIIESLKYKKEFWESRKSNHNNRMTMMHTAQSLSDYAKLLKTVVLNQKGNKVILFAELTDEVDKIAVYRFHGKETDRTVIDQLNSGEISELGVVRKVNRGVNFEGLNHAIIHSYTSSITNATQAYIGRMVRLEPGQIATIHFLVSYYYEGDNKIYCKNHDWLMSVLESDGLKHLKVNYYDGINLMYGS